MLKGNMPVGDSVRRKGREELTVKSVVWNSIIDTFKSEKKMDITDYLISIQLRNNVVLVKVSKPIIKTEIHYISDKIKQMAQEKLSKIGIKIIELDIKYI